MIKNVRRGDTVVTTGGIVGRVTKVADEASEIEVEIAAERPRQGRAHDDLRGPRQGRAGQGRLTALARACRRKGRHRDKKRTRTDRRCCASREPRSSRRWRVILIGLLPRRAEHLLARAAQGLHGRRCRAGSRAGSSRPAPSCSASTSRAARTSCSRSTRTTSLRDPDHGPARRRPPDPARGRRDARGRHPAHRRAASRSAIADAAARAKVLPKLRELSQPISQRPPRPGRRPHARHRPRSPTASIQLTLTERA